MWAELPDDVREELEDPRFTSRTHGTRGTYARASDGGKGCRGPLCKKAERDDAQKKYAARRAARGMKAEEGKKDEKARARDEELSKIQLWHCAQREMARLNRLVQVDVEPEDDLEAVI